jgi:hypothetical protein
MQCTLVSQSYLPYVSLFTSCVRGPFDGVYQAAKEIESGHDELVNLLESIERFLRRIEIYTQIPHTPALDETVVKIMMELLSTLALATKGLKKCQSSEFVLVDKLSYSMQRSKILQEILWSKGRRGGITETRPTDTRRDSDDRSGDSQSYLQPRPEYECSHRW